MIAQIIVEEIKNALKDINDITTPGVDGYGAKFFKASWDVINMI